MNITTQTNEIVSSFQQHKPTEIIIYTIGSVATKLRNIWTEFQNPPIKFERSKGFWSTPSDESKDTFFSKLTEPKSQREHWYRVTPT